MTRSPNLALFKRRSAPWRFLWFLMAASLPNAPALAQSEDAPAQTPPSRAESASAKTQAEPSADDKDEGDELGSVAAALEKFEGDEARRLKETRRDSLNIFRHNLNYFVSGKPDSKVQFSFKVQPITQVDLFMGYTQVMFWELAQKDSSPFSDVNYNPELFYRWYQNSGALKGVDFGLWEHRSNGRDGLDSRSWDRSYVAFRWEHSWRGLEIRSSAKAFYLYNLDSTNPDIRTTLGFSEFSAAVGDLFPSFLRDAEFEAKVAPGGTINFQEMQGYQELNFRFRLTLKRFNPFIFMQLHNGLNESLLLYSSQRTSYRIGLAI